MKIGKMKYLVLILVLFGSAYLFAETRGHKVENKDLKKKLTEMQYHVTQEEGTERAFQNEYWDNHEPGIYVDIVDGTPLFSSKDKYDSGTGWPSFTKPIEGEAVGYKDDRKLFVSRTEVHSASAGSHLGHVFEDGPQPTGKRYCINSAALKFVPADKLKEQGYDKYADQFKQGAAASSSAEPVYEEAILAGGCFWGMEEIIRKIPGVLETDVGYAGGSSAAPSYDLVKTGSTGYAESIRVRFDPAKLSYKELLGYFFRMHDPTTLNRQGNDVGTQYRSAIFYENEEQASIAEQAKEEAQSSGRWKNPIVTKIVPAGQFYLAEEYHQDYLKKHPGGYTCHYLRD